ncbi:MAG: aminoacyl-tRNA hydrolase [PS1 clade bacterium]
MAIKLIVGLGNPGKGYQSHRHNVGFWFVDALAKLYPAKFKNDSKLFCDLALSSVSDFHVRVVKPNTYMNRSGQSIQSVAKFFKINVDEVLIVHDDLDLEPGFARLKFGGGHGGHNGLRDAIKALGSNDFYRLRVGIGHPGDSSQVSDYVLHSPGSYDLGLIQNALVDSLNVIEKVVAGENESAMKALHTNE